MVHGDNRGLVIPPKIAPTQAIIVPVAQHKEGVLDKAYDLRDKLANVIRVDIDGSDHMPGWKFNQSEMKGYPIRIELGPKDIEKDQVVLVRRDTGEKEFVPMNELEARLPILLDEIKQNLYNKAYTHREEKTSTALNMDEFKTALKENPGFIKAMWCGKESCEEYIQEETGATSRCIPFEQEHLADTCVCCDEEATDMVYWARAYEIYKCYLSKLISSIFYNKKLCLSFSFGI